MKPEIKTRRYVLCPDCKQSELTVEHLLVGPEKRGGPWYCHNSACRMGFMVNANDDGSIDLEPCERGDAPGFGLLKFGDLYLVHRQKFGNYVDDPAADYMYHSHQCPVGILGEIEEVFDVRGSDPHGVMRYVASIIDTPENSKALEETRSLQGLFALFGTDGQPAPSAWPEENRGVIPWVADMQRDYEKKGDG